MTPEQELRAKSLEIASVLGKIFVDSNFSHHSEATVFRHYLEFSQKIEKYIREGDQS
jgi:hypothetical protein